MITAPQLARTYDLTVASLWRGEASVDDRFLTWLGSFRATDCPPEPKERPDAVSLLGGGGTGIRWYATPTAVFGYTTGQPLNCYRIPIAADLPDAKASVPQRPIVVPLDAGIAALG